jgi:Ca2+-binding RTX toxin-like protein
MARVISRAPNGVLVGDQRKDQILLLQDIDGDGTASGAGETTVFFDGNNASGLTDPTNNIFTTHQASDKSVYAGDGNTDAVYRLRDQNEDGDAQDAGEANIWFSAENAAGFSTVTPNGIHEGSDGSIYIVNAGVRSAPQDAIYRTLDLNGDGDVNDEGEATLWLDLQTVVETSSAFDLNFDGDVAYLSDTAGFAANAIYRIEDTNGDGAIQTDEVTTFISEDMNFDAPVEFANAVGVGGSLYTLSFVEATDINFKLFRLTDLDGSGQIDDATETAEVWNASSLPEEFNAQIGFSVTADEDGNVVLTGNAFDGNSHVISLADLNGDGDFLDAGETSILGSSTYDAQLARARAVEYFEGTAQVTTATAGAGNHFSVFLDTDTNTLYTSGENVVGQLGNGATGFDVKTPLAVQMPEGFDANIVSVSAGLLHTTFLTEDGDVYAFGFNNRGPLGTGDEITQTAAVKVEALDGVNIATIENGNGVSYAVSDTGTLYAWGSNSNGQLGLGDRDTRLEPTVVEALAHETVVSVSSGTSFTLALTADGQVWAFGSNTDGQLGSPDALEEDGSPARRVTSPVLVDGLPDNVTSVTADTKTSFAVTADGRVFGWGESRYGQLLQGSDNEDGTFTVDNADVLAPVELTDFLPDGVVEINGGARWFMALTENGDVYAWGPNDEGPTGGLDGDPAAETDSTFYPTRMTELDDVNVVELHTGPNSITAVTETGEIFTWGSNSDGRLGFSSEGSVYVPTQIQLGGEADPFLLAADPGDNARDLSNDATFTLTFTEDVRAGEGTLTLVNRNTGERVEIDVTDTRLVSFDGDTVVVTPPEHLDADARYYIEITDGAFVDLDGKGYEGIAAGDRTTFNFTTNETAAASEPTKGSQNDDLLRGGSDADSLYGGSGNDIVSGADGDDLLVGGAGNDIINGGADNDTLRGNNGADEIVAGAGDDTVFAGNGNDTIFGGLGNDSLSGSGGADLIHGDYGNDTLAGENGNDVLFGGIGNDVLSGGYGDDSLHGGDAADRIYASRGDDSASGGDGADLLEGGAGDDTLSGDQGNDTLRGNDGADEISGGAGDDAVYAGNDNDTVFGGLGNDSLSGSGGADLIYGDDGHDTLVGENGEDALFGGLGNDVLIGGNGADTLNGGEDADLLFGDAGADSLLGGAGNDTLNGDQQNDVLFGEDGQDVLRGGDGADTLDGGADADRLVGGNGADVMRGGLGIDMLIGEAGSDTFDFNDVTESSFAAQDVIIGMTGVGLAGGDRIDLTDIDANSSTGVNDAFVFLGDVSNADGLAAGPGSLWVVDFGTQTRLFGTTDGTSIDLAIRINDGADTTAADYIVDDFLL